MSTTRLALLTPNVIDMNQRLPSACRRVALALGLSVCLALGSARAQTGESGRGLSLDQAVTQALEQGWTMDQRRAATQAAAAARQRSRAAFLPQANLSAMAVRTNNPLQSFGIQLQQEVVEQADFNPARLNAPDAITNYQYGLNLRQPLVNPDAWRERAAADARYRAVRLQEAFSAHRVRFRVKQAYYGAQLSAARIEVLERALAAAEEAERITADAQEEGMVQKADLLAVRVRARSLEAQLEDARQEAQTAREQLALLLGRDALPPGTALTDSLRAPRAPENEAPVDPGLEERSDIMAMRAGLEARKQLLASKRQGYLPTLNGFGGYQWNDADIGGFGAENWTLGLKLEWSLFEGWGRIGAIREQRARLAEARAGMEAYRARQSAEWRQAVRRLDAARRQLPTARLAVEQAEEVYRMRRNRQEEGMALTSDLLRAEATMAEERLRYLQTLYRYRMAEAQIAFLSEEKAE